MSMRGFRILPEFTDKIASLSEELNLSFIPQRGTKKSAGYDFRCIEDVTIYPGEIKLIPTGLTAYMQDDDELQLRCRSSLALEGLSVANGVGTVDADYEGKHIQFIYANRGHEDIKFKAGDKIGQGIFSKYLITDEDYPLSEERTGGFGSTGTK